MIRIDKTVRRDDYPVRETLVAQQFGGMAVLYEPPGSPAKSRVAVVIMHSDMNYMALNMAPELAKRGYTVLAADGVPGGEMEPKIEQLGRFVEMLRGMEGVEKVVLMGHSGGATLMTAYQAAAENGPEIFRGEGMIYKTPLRKKPEPADGLMLIDANYGNSVMTLLSMDPAVTREGNGMDLDPAFDLFAPENGYDGAGAAYLPEFREKYWRAQRERNERLVDLARERLALIEKGEGRYLDDEPFLITAAAQPKPNNRMLPEDVSLLSHTGREHDLLHGDGTLTREIIRCVRTPEIDRSFSSTYSMGVDRISVRGFLSSQATRTTPDFAVKEDGITGVCWRSGYATPIGNIETISCPALFMGMTGSYEYLAAEMIFDHAKMADKSICFLHGAGHMFAPNRQAEKFPGEFGDTETALYDYMAGWLERFC